MVNKQQNSNIYNEKDLKYIPVLCATLDKKYMDGIVYNSETCKANGFYLQKKGYLWELIYVENRIHYTDINIIDKYASILDACVSFICKKSDTDDEMIELLNDFLKKIVRIELS